MHTVIFWTGAGPFTGTFSATVGDGGEAGDTTPLPTGATVEFRAYAINSIGTGYSSTQSFIPSGPPEVTTTPADVGQITQNSAVLGGDVTSDGGGTVSDYGVYYILDPGVPTDGTKVPMGSGTGIFFAEVGGLNSGATYNFAAYADNGTEVVGSTLQFTTLAGPPTIDPDSRGVVGCAFPEGRNRSAIVTAGENVGASTNGVRRALPIATCAGDAATIHA